MKREIHYLNTDLDLMSVSSLEAFATTFDSSGISTLHVGQREDGCWHATLETEKHFCEPEPNLEGFLTAIEAFDDQMREMWFTCHSREFNIGYECGDEPWAFNQGLTVATLSRMAALDISIRITIYPAECEVSKTPAIDDLA